MYTTRSMEPSMYNTLGYETRERLNAVILDSSKCLLPILLTMMEQICDDDYFCNSELLLCYHGDLNACDLAVPVYLTQLNH